MVSYHYTNLSFNQIGLTAGISSFPDLRKFPFPSTGNPAPSVATRNPDDAAVADTSDSHAATPQHRIELESGTCSDSLKNAEYSPYNFCSEVIYYDFYVGHDQTLASLDAEAYA